MADSILYLTFYVIIVLNPDWNIDDNLHEKIENNLDMSSIVQDVIKYSYSCVVFFFIQRVEVYVFIKGILCLCMW